MFPAYSFVARAGGSFLRLLFCRMPLDMPSTSMPAAVGGAGEPGTHLLDWPWHLFAHPSWHLVYLSIGWHVTLHYLLLWLLLPKHIYSMSGDCTESPKLMMRQNFPWLSLSYSVTLLFVFLSFTFSPLMTSLVLSWVAVRSLGMKTFISLRFCWVPFFVVLLF